MTDTINKPLRSLGTINKPPRLLGSGVSASGGNIARGTADAQTTLAADGNNPLVLPFGKHLFTGGQLIYRKYATGNSRFAIALGDGAEKGWGQIVDAYYAGQALSVSPNGSTEGYRFHPGTLSTGFGDTVQGADAFFADQFTASGTAYAAVLLPAAYATEDTPYKFSCVAECLKVPDFDVIGNITGWSYSPNPARVAAYGIYVDTVNQLEKLGVPATDPLVAVYLQRRVHWASLYRLKTICDEEISWNDGTSTRDIPRFECHLMLTGATKLMDFLQQVMATCCSFVQDDAGLLKFVTPFDAMPVHHFTDGSDGLRCNVFDTYNLQPADLNTKLRNVAATFGDTDTDLLDKSTTQWRSDSLLQRFGEAPISERAYPNMTHSQAQRVLRWQMQLETDFTEIATVKGHGDAIHVLPGDCVTVTLERLGWSNVKCLVLSCDLENAEKSNDANTFNLQKINGDLYSDAWHTAVQRAVSPT